MNEQPPIVGREDKSKAETIAKSVAKPDAFSKPGSVRFRPAHVKAKAIKRKRLMYPDKRYVKFY